MKKRTNKLYFSLIELLAAMAIFLILSTVMMRFFNSAQQVWNSAEKRNELYSDARVIMNLVSRDLQAAMYNNQDSPEGICPFWFQQVDITDGNFTSTPYNSSSEDLACSEDLKLSKKVFQLNFIGRTDIRVDFANTLNVCELKYLFLPYRYDKTAPYDEVQWNVNGNVPGGCILRSCTTSKEGVNVYNFSKSGLAYADKDAARVYKIFTNDSGTVSYMPYSKVIGGVLDFKLTCLAADSNGNLKTIAPFECSDGSTVNWPSGYDITYPNITLTRGTPYPDAVRMELSMMAEKDFEKWLVFLKADNDVDAEKFKRKKVRTFIKTVFLTANQGE
jgi:type II secretory pathway pseudopilin PulG